MLSVPAVVMVCSGCKIGKGVEGESCSSPAVACYGKANPFYRLPEVVGTAYELI